MNRGDVILIKYPFSDLGGIKVRPAIVISNSIDQDALFILITSNVSSQRSADYLIKQSHPDFKQTGLKKDSLVKVDKIVCLKKSLAERKLGTLSKGIQVEIDRILRSVLGL